MVDFTLFLIDKAFMAKCYQQVTGTAVTALKGGDKLRSVLSDVNNTLVLVVIILVLIAQSGVGLT